MTNSQTLKDRPISGAPADFEQLFRRGHSILLRFLLSSGDAWGVLSQSPALLAEMRALLREADRVGASRSSGIAHAAVLLSCAEKMHEISGAAWRSDPEKLRVSDFGKDEYIVKYPDLAANISYYFRVLGDDVSPMLIE